MGSVAFESFVIAVLILFNGVLAMAEISVVSSRKARLQQRVNDGDKRALLALKLANEPGDFLSTVQIGITMVGVLAGAFGGATIAGSLAAWLAQVPVLEPFSATLGLLLVVALITFASLIFGELAPKRLALNNPEDIASMVAGPMRLLSWVTAPVVHLLSAATDLVLRLLGTEPSLEPAVTEEEVKVMIEQGTQAGIFQEAEQDMLVGVFRLGDLRIENLITPRTEIDWLDFYAPSEEHLKTILESGHSRFVVAKGSVDNVVGLVQAKDLMGAYLKNGAANVGDHLRDPLFVPENMPALKVLELIRDTRLPMALVIDEFGGLQGLVTVNDILEAIVGDVSVRGEMDDPEVVQREDGSWLLDGMLPMDEVSTVLKVSAFPGSKEGHYSTLGGFMMTYLGHVPSPADHFEWEGLRFEVMDMDGLRVDKVLVMPVPPPAG